MRMGIFLTNPPKSTQIHLTHCQSLQTIGYCGTIHRIQMLRTEPPSAMVSFVSHDIGCITNHPCVFMNLIGSALACLVSSCLQAKLHAIKQLHIYSRARFRSALLMIIKYHTKKNPPN